MLQKPKILYRYVFKEVLSPFLLSLSIFTGILFLTKSLKLVELVVNRNVSIGDIAQLFLFVVPQFLEMAVPMSLLLGAILAFGRLSSDSELIVMRASGVGMRQLLRPILLFSLLAAMFSLVLSFVVRPWSNYQLGMKMFEMAQQKASSGLIAGVFNEFGTLTMYAERVGDNGADLKNVIIADRRTPSTPRNFIARHGSIVSDEVTRSVNLRLYDGSIHEGEGLNYNVTYFDVNAVSIDQNDLLGEGDSKDGKKANEMLMNELIRERQNLHSSLASEEDESAVAVKRVQRSLRLDVEFHRRFVLPASCFVVAVLGMALGVQPSRGGKSWGASINVTAGILLITGYYFVLAFGTALGEQGVLPVWFALWIPNVVFAVIGSYVFKRIESEEWSAVSQALGDFVSRLSYRFVRRGRVA